MDKILKILNENIWLPIKAIFASNRDFPYHDYIEIDNSQSEDELSGSYQIGTANVNLHGDQMKRFVAKRTLIYADYLGATVKFNNSNNVEIPLIETVIGVDGAVYRYKGEYHCNITTIYYTIPDGTILQIYTEGVLPQETRDAE